MPIDRLMFNIMSSNIQASRDFYVSLFDLTTAFDSDWYVLLTAPQGLELGLIDRDSEVVPPAFRALPQGGYLTFVVADVAVIHQRAIDRGLTVEEPPRDLFYGQRRMLLRDPDGLLIDVSSPTPT